MKSLEKLMGMSDEVWARHTNPLSGWSRMTILPLFALAIWSRVWLGWWCLVLIAFVIIWTWWNPRAFRVPDNTNNWMSKGVLGERIWLAHSDKPVADHHVYALRVLTILTGFWILLFGYGLYFLDVWTTVFGMVMIVVFKLWFLDRMVWLYEDEN